MLQTDKKCWSKPQSWLMITWYIYSVYIYIHTYWYINTYNYMHSICTLFILVSMFFLLPGHRLLDCDTGQSVKGKMGPHALKWWSFFVREISPRKYPSFLGLGGGNSNIVYFHPKIGEDCPFWLIFFRISEGLKPPTRFRFRNYTWN